ncbi:metallo-beta-lactamase superfamily protein [mine drainage metagenome]|jgi:alkyl sulfatase BDS1-like metallo-beta-lactamase superfamily hydrolase|uniref:Metallo-beta-lactamase superfamily protein n=1 Tax=mine drainage metagenome TaxID=410659 RepID=A0A1J5QXX3_9ZZZZ
MCQYHSQLSEDDARRAKPASAVTAAMNASIRGSFNLDDPVDFEEAARGHIASMSKARIAAVGGGTAYDPAAFDFVDGSAPDTVNPSLWRQETLNNHIGLFKVCEGIWQVRGYDAANMTLIRGDSGWIVIDPLTSAEVARAVLDFALGHLGVLPVVAVIYTHAHADHFGGVRGVISEHDVAAGRVQVIAPDKFMEYAIAENVMAGNAMARRAQYQFGGGLEPGLRGGVGVGLGKAVSNGTLGLIAPTRTIMQTSEEHEVDGVRIVFQMAQASESPSEMMFYFPKMKAVCLSEVACALMHNIYTPRGAQARDALRWSKYINECLDLFPEAEVAFRSHHWPLWGRERIRDSLRRQRDTYRFIHDRALFLANQGHKMADLANAEYFPKELGEDFSCHGYYGTLSHNLRGVYNFYLGFYDGNPATLHPLGTCETARRYVEAIGGQLAVTTKAHAAFAAGDYRWAAELNNHAVFADPSDEGARLLQADILEQLGYQAESAIWRNEYLMAARELRHGIKPVPHSVMTAEMLGAMSLEMMFDLVSIRLDHAKLDGMRLDIEIEFTDREEVYALELSNSVLNHTLGRRLGRKDLIVRTTTAAWLRLLTRAATMAELVGEGEVELAGNPGALGEILGKVVDFARDFAIVTPL